MLFFWLNEKAHKNIYIVREQAAGRYRLDFFFMYVLEGDELLCWTPQIQHLHDSTAYWLLLGRTAPGREGRFHRFYMGVMMVSAHSQGRAPRGVAANADRSRRRRALVAVLAAGAMMFSFCSFFFSVAWSRTRGPPACHLHHHTAPPSTATTVPSRVTFAADSTSSHRAGSGGRW